MVRKMLKNKSLPKNFWTEVASWSVYILNLGPSKDINMINEAK